MRNQQAAAALQTAEVLRVECLTFGIAPRVTPSGKPPVRIFLGTEEAQSRAERVFLYAVRKQRDPARVYQVYLMKDLPGFDRRSWRTGFTQYRFAIPELAGGYGRAIYNDVDQIYLADPAALFDLDLEGCGYRAVAANDTSVMVMDCARMLRWWNVRTAQASGKRELVDAPAAEPGLWGALDGGWNARDLEYRAGESKLLHYTTLHLQPWRPTPEQYSYHPHPLGSLWQRLEREADAQRYQPFTRAQPSLAYRQLLAERKAPLLPEAPAETVAVEAHLERLPPQDRPWFLEALFALALRSVRLRVDLRYAVAAAARAAPARLAPAAESWRESLAQAAERRPGVAWTLELVGPGGSSCFEYRPLQGAPRVWVLLGRHEGDNRQLLALAAALGWPCETRKLVFKPRLVVPTWLQGASLARLDRRRSEDLSPPWPDLVLACGRRSAPVARWIRRRSAGAARLVHLGRPQAPLAAFDLVVTTPQYGLPGRANVLHNALPLNRAAPRRSERAASAWLPKLAALPRPWIGLLVGGNSSSSELDAAAASRLRSQAEALARSRGGSLLVATSPRTPAKAAEVLLADSAVPGIRYCWRADDPHNPYPLFLERADELIVTGDSASMLAEACASGRPVHYFALPWPAKRRRISALALRLLARRRNRRGERGTPKQQDRIGRWLDGLLAAGVLRPPRELTAVHEALRWGGLAQPLGEPQALAPAAACDDLDRTVAKVRRLLLSGRAVAP
jgi:mitochondrial fission protein ELM1